MLCLAVMTDERLILAIGRLERALSRIEAKVGGGAGDGLRARHQNLRDRVAGTVERIDRLLETS